MAVDEKPSGMLKWAEYTLLFVAIALAGVLMPGFSYLAYVLLPLPVMFTVLRYDFKYGLLCLGGAALSLMYAFQPFRPELALDLLQFGMFGLVLGLFFKYLESSGRILALTILVAVGLAVLAAGAAYQLNGQNPLVLNPEERQMLTRQWAAMNQQMHLLEEEATPTAPGEENDSFQYLTEVYQYYLPGQLVVTAAVTAAFTFILAMFLLGRYGFKVPPGPSFSGIYLPWYSIWALILALGLFLLGDNYNDLMAKVGKNTLFILVNLYLIMGLAVLVYFFQIVKVSLLLKFLLVVIMLIIYPLSFIFLITIGAIDPLANFRRLPKLK